MKSIKLDSFGVKAIVAKKFAKKKRIINFSKWILSQDFQKQSSRSVLLFLEISQSSQENNCARASFLMNFIKKETLAQVLFCEFCEISKNTFLHRAPQAAVSGLYQQHF